MEVRELENAQLRERARAALGRYFLQAVSVSFIARFFLTAGHVEDAGNAEEYGTLTIDIGSWSWNVYQTSAPEPWLIQINGLMPENLVRTAVTALVGAASAGLLILLLSIFVFDLFEVGRNRFYMESREAGRPAGMGKLVWPFRCGNYFNLVRILFLRRIKTYLWTFLLVIPGIYKACEYAMVPYILAENPEVSSGTAFRISRQLMDGRKWKLVCLTVSVYAIYIPLVFLLAFSVPVGAAALFLGSLFINAYMDAAQAEFYASVRGRALGIRLNGFSFSDGL